MDNSQTELEAPLQSNRRVFLLAALVGSCQSYKQGSVCGVMGTSPKSGRVDLFEVRGEIGIIIIETGQLF